MNHIFTHAYVIFRDIQTKGSCVSPSNQGNTYTSHSIFNREIETTQLLPSHFFNSRETYRRFSGVFLQPHHVGKYAHGSHAPPREAHIECCWATINFPPPIENRVKLDSYHYICKAWTRVTPNGRSHRRRCRVCRHWCY